MLSEKYRNILEMFQLMSVPEQLDFVENALHTMDRGQIGQVDRIIRPLLLRDFIAHLPEDLPACILKYLDAETLANCEAVSRSWRFQLARAQVWRKVIERHVKADNLWKELSEKKKWKKFILVSREISQQLICEHYNENYNMLRKHYAEMVMLQHKFYRELYPSVKADIAKIEKNWKKGNYSLKTINCNSEQSKGVYCIQYDDEKIICGLRDNTIKIWNREDLTCSNTLSGHSGSVLCLQYDKRFIISGSSDSTIRMWNVDTGECFHTLLHHGEAVLHLRFNEKVMVTCSKDRSIAVWDIISSKEMKVRRVLVGHRAAVNVIDFDEKFIVSASGDRTIKIWSTEDYECVKTLTGHLRGIACLQYRGTLIVSGSSDNTIRLWDVNTGVCHRVLQGHNELVRCVRFDDKRIVSGAYDGKIKVWDLKGALDTRIPSNELCVSSLYQHTGRVFRLQFDEFQIISSSHDDTILIWDFLNTDGVQEPMEVDSNVDNQVDV